MQTVYRFRRQTVDISAQISPALCGVTGLTGTCSLELIGWNTLAWPDPSHFLCFTVYRVKPTYQHQTFYSARTQNRQLADRE